MYSTTLQTFDLEALNSSSSTECQSTPCSGLKKCLYLPLLLVLEVCNVKPTYRKSQAGNLLMWSDLTFGPSFKVKQGYPKFEVLISHLFLVLEVCNVKPSCITLWARNLLMWSDLTLGFSFKAKRCLIGFGELSFW